MTNTPLLHNIKRPPAARVSGLTGPAVLLFAPWMQAPPAVGVSIYPDAAPRGPFYREPWTPGPSRYSGGIYSPARLDDLSQPNGLNGSKAGERPERPERLKVTRTNELNELNGLNDLKQAYRYPGGEFKAERVERLN